MKEINAAQFFGTTGTAYMLLILALLLFVYMVLRFGENSHKHGISKKNKS